MNMHIELNVKQVRDQIASLMLAHPELAADDVLREDMIEGSTSTHEFLSKIVRMIGENTNLCFSLCNYIEELESRMSRFERRNHALRDFVFKIMSTADLQKVQLPEATLSIRAGHRKVIITDEHLILDQYCRTKREPDKAMIREALLAGAIVSGAELSNAESALTIRTK